MQGNATGHERRREQGRNKEGAGSAVKVRFEPKKKINKKCGSVYRGGRGAETRSRKKKKHGKEEEEEEKRK